MKDYVIGLKELENNEVNFIVMVCNTIHLYRDKLQKTIRTPILNLREEMLKEIKKNNVKKTLVLGTPMTTKKLYNFKGTTIKPSQKEIQKISKAIFLFNNGTEKTKQVVKIKSICNKYFKQGAKIVILGCTELSVMLEKENIQKICSIDVLVNATIKKIREEELKKTKGVDYYE